ncbi:MAG: hypothetical protein ABIP68_06685 [Ferruginibacter sp.]
MNITALYPRIIIEFSIGSNFIILFEATPGLPVSINLIITDIIKAMLQIITNFE